jgi:PAS domain S-box-containing protein
VSERRVLLVEDERIVAMDVRSRLQRLGYIVTGIASTGDDALRLAVESRPDLALVDIRIKGAMDGIEVAQNFRQMGIPVIFVTAYADSVTVDRAKQTEPFGYLIKPFDEKELLTAIELALHNSSSEARLIESQQWLGATLRCIGDGVVATDGQLMVKFMNPVAESLTGFSEFAGIGRPLGEIFPLACEDAARSLRENTTVRRTGAVAAPGEDGECILDLAASPILDSKQAPLGVVVAFRDVTAQRRAEKRLAEQAWELERSNKELEHFAYVASHDLQEPLRMVGSYVQLLARRYQGRLDGDADEFIGFALDGVRRMRQFIEDLLAYSRAFSRSKIFQPIDCMDLLDDVMADLKQVIIDTGATVTHDRLPMVSGDPMQLRRVFQNLIGNALKFHGVDPPAIHVSAERQPSQWIFSVQDNGLGIAPEDRERIFLLFERAHAGPDNPGTGIGLAISQRIIEGHGGNIWVESEPGRGSVFHFTIPDPGGRSV